MCSSDLTPTLPAEDVIIAIAPVGDRRAEHLLAAGRIRAVIEHPVGTPASRVLLSAALRGGDLAQLQYFSSETSTGKVEATFAGSKVLVVDDLEINREILGEVLQRLGVAADFAEDGEQALRMLEMQTYDLA